MMVLQLKSVVASVAQHFFLGELRQGQQTVQLLPLPTTSNLDIDVNVDAT